MGDTGEIITTAFTAYDDANMDLQRFLRESYKYEKLTFDEKVRLFKSQLDAIKNSRIEALQREITMLKESR